MISAAAAREELGLGCSVLRGLVRAGSLVGVCRGGYADAALLADATPEQAHRVRLRAVLGTNPKGYAASHQSAAVLLGLPMLARDLVRVHVLRRRGEAHGRSMAAFTVHQCHGDEEVRLVDDVPSVGPVAAVLGAASLCSSAGVQGVIDAALRSGVVTREDLASGLQTWGSRRGGPTLRQALAQADPTAESLGESGLRVLLLALGYRVRPQVVIRDDDGVVARVDFYLPDLGVVVEFDGALKYADADGRRALVKEKVREDRLRALGLGVVRVMWADLAHPERIRAQIERAALVRSRR